jgi:hypothetical protein
VCVAGLFYAAFGALRLGVWLDVGLAAASLALLAHTLSGGMKRSMVHTSASAS